MKIQLFAFLTLMLLVNRQRMELLIWTIVLSLGFYGVKGGLFTIRTAGNFTVKGPQGTFIEGNNELAFALVIAIPLMRYPAAPGQERVVSRGLGIAMGLCFISVIGSYSRGALLAVSAMGFFLIWKSRQRKLMMVLLVLLVPR